MVFLQKEGAVGHAVYLAKEEDKMGWGKDSELWHMLDLFKEMRCFSPKTLSSAAKHTNN